MLSFGGIYSFWALLARDNVVACVNGAKPVAEGVTVCRADFNSVFGLSEVLPGPQVNVAAIIGHKMSGFPGMLVFLLGLLTPGLVITPVLFHYYRKYRRKPSVTLFLQGTGIIVIAILLVFLLRILRGNLTGTAVHSIGGIVLFTTAFLLSNKARLNPMLAVFSGAVFGLLFLQ
jgi:chromate transporter